MAGTVLGKRTRGDVDSGKIIHPTFPCSLSSSSHPLSLALPVRTASKRRTVAPRVHTVPTPLRRTRSTVKKTVEQSDQENGESKPVSENVASKHTLRDDQFKSPVKINSHFTVSKPVEGKLEILGCGA